MFRFLIFLPLVTLAAGCASMTERSTGLVDGGLTDCPAAPRCVSSQAGDPDKRVPALRLQQPADQAWPAVREAVAGMPRTTIVTADDRYLHAEVVSPWRVYTDDLELLLEPEAGRIQVRSSARIGYYDFQVNRERMEALAERLEARGVAEPAGSQP